jgi:hypothetical protein
MEFSSIKRFKNDIILNGDVMSMNGDVMSINGDVMSMNVCIKGEKNK